MIRRTIYRQAIGLSIGTYCAPVIADLFFLLLWIKFWLMNVIRNSLSLRISPSVGTGISDEGKIHKSALHTVIFGFWIQGICYMYTNVRCRSRFSGKYSIFCLLIIYVFLPFWPIYSNIPRSWLQRNLMKKLAHSFKFTFPFKDDVLSLYNFKFNYSVGASFPIYLKSTIIQKQKCLHHS